MAVEMLFDDVVVTKCRCQVSVWLQHEVIYIECGCDQCFHVFAGVCEYIWPQYPIERAGKFSARA